MDQRGDNCLATAPSTLAAPVQHHRRGAPVVGFFSAPVVIVHWAPRSHTVPTRWLGPWPLAGCRPAPSRPCLPEAGHRDARRRWRTTESRCRPSAQHGLLRAPAPGRSGATRRCRPCQALRPGPSAPMRRAPYPRVLRYSSLWFSFVRAPIVQIAATHSGVRCRHRQLVLQHGSGASFS